MPSTDPSLFHSSEGRGVLHAQAEAFVSRGLSMARRARRLVTADRIGALDLLAARRGALCQHLHAYQQFKHGCIFDPVIEHGTRSSQIVARTLKVECMQMGELFGAYHSRWLRMDRGEWRAYRRDMIATADTLMRHLESEAAAIRKLLTISDFYGGSPRLVPTAA